MVSKFCTGCVVFIPSETISGVSFVSGICCEISLGILAPIHAGLFLNIGAWTLVASPTEGDQNIVSRIMVSFRAGVVSKFCAGCFIFIPCQTLSGASFV